MRDEKDYENLKKFIKITIDFDNKLYERVIKNIMINQEIKQNSFTN